MKPKCEDRMKLKPITVGDIEARFELASYHLFGKISAPIFRRGSGYGIRILKSQSYSRTGNQTRSYEYFDLDSTGRITCAPRGLTKQFKGALVRDIEARMKALEASP